MDYVVDSTLLSSRVNPRRWPYTFSQADTVCGQERIVPVERARDDGH